MGGGGLGDEGLGGGGRRGGRKLTSMSFPRRCVADSQGSAEESLLMSFVPAWSRTMLGCWWRTPLLRVLERMWLMR